MTPAIPFSDTDWARLERDWTAWWNHDLDRPMVMASSWMGPKRQRPAWWDGRQLGGIPIEVPVEEIADQVEQDLARTIYHGDSWPRFFNNFGPGAVAAFLGGLLKATDQTTWFYPGRWAGVALAELRPRFDDGEFWWRRVQDLTRVCLERFAGRAQMSFTDLGGGLDIAASLRDTQVLLTDCLDDPDAVEDLCRRITPAWLQYYRKQCELILPAGRGTSPWAPIWSPQRCYMLQCDFAYMIGPRQFARFVIPDIAACCAEMEHGFYHLDGKGQLPHLDQLLALPDLKGVQWIPGDGNPPAADPLWWPVLRRIRDAGKLVQIYATSSHVLRLADEVPLTGFALETWNEDGSDNAALLAEVLRRNQRLTLKSQVAVAG